MVKYCEVCCDVVGVWRFSFGDVFDCSFDGDGLMVVKESWNGGCWWFDYVR